MLFSEFCLAAIEHIQQGDYGIKPTVKLYTDGYRSSDPAELFFIRTANIKYHNVESDTLIGTFFEIIWPKGTEYASICRIDAAELMKRYESSGWKGVDEVIQESVNRERQVDASYLNDIEHYDLIRDRLIICPLPYPLNAAALRECVFWLMGDIALTLYVRISDENLNLFSAKVPTDIADQWGIPRPKLFTEAIRNTARFYPPRLYLSPYELLDPPYTRGIFMGKSRDRITRIPRDAFVTLTTTRKVYGAAAMFYVGVKERLAKLFGGSYYVSFIDINQANLFPVRTSSAQGILNALKSSNKFFPDDMLTERVFVYDAEEKKISLVDV